MNTAFVLPDGRTLGGVTTWVLEMAQQLGQMTRPINLIEHASFNPALDIALPPVPLIDCTALRHPNHPHLTSADIHAYLPHYRRTLPGVMVPNWSYGAYATCAALTQVTPQAVRVLGIAHADGTDYYDWLTYYESIIHLFVAVSAEIEAALKTRLPHRQADIVLLPYAVSTPTTLSRSYSAAGRPLQLVYAGRLAIKQKRVLDLIKLAEVLLNEAVHFRLLIFGSGVDEVLLRDYLQTCSPLVQQCVQLMGHVGPEKMSAIWQMSDICLLVSDYEGTSISMLEAMAQGCVPVVTQVSGTTSVIASGQNGYLLPIGEVTQMARVIKQLDKDRTQLARVGHQAHLMSRMRISYESYLTQFHTYLAYVWSQPPRVWPETKPLLPSKRMALELADVQQVLKGNRTAVKHLLLKLSAKPGLRWTYRYRHVAKTILKL